MSEAGDFELFSGPAAQEKSEISDEQIREQMAQAQAAIAQLWKEESQFKAGDRNLAGIIVQFLGQPGNTDLFLLISRAVAQNIPSEIILAIIALIDERSMQEVYSMLRGGKEGKGASLTVSEPVSFQSIPLEHKQAIGQWTSNLYHVALRRPKRALESIVTEKPTCAISPVIVQLSAFILRKYMDRFSIPAEWGALRDFSQAMFVQIVRNLEVFVFGQKHLKEAA